MILEIPGITVPDDVTPHVVYSPVSGESDKGRARAGLLKPRHLVPLGDAQWPKDVIEHIEAVFKAIGIEDPRRQKLIEPYARVFNGVVDGSGEYKLDAVNWQIVKDYFAWEAAAWTDPARAKALQEKAREDHGFIFSHHGVYANPSSTYIE